MISTQRFPVRRLDVWRRAGPEQGSQRGLWSSAAQCEQKNADAFVEQWPPSGERGQDRR